ncbi:MAG: hypothetical protein WKF84_29450 [Pyrinomonadaceae bacterium]
MMVIGSVAKKPPSRGWVEHRCAYLNAQIACKVTARNYNARFDFNLRLRLIEQFHQAPNRLDVVSHIGDDQAIAAPVHLHTTTP